MTVKITPSKRELISTFQKNALNGASKIGAITAYKKSYNLDDNEIEWLIEACNFNSEPKNIDYLKFYNNPITKRALEIRNQHVQLYTIPNFLTKNDCKLLTAIIEQESKPATLHKDGGRDERYQSENRTSNTVTLSYHDHDFYLKIDRKITEVMDLHPFSGEAMHGQKYEIGEFYKEHNDYFIPSELETYCCWMGQRTWTTMLYLNDVEEGGETYFPSIDLKLKPTEGTLIIWNNLNKDGSNNIYSRHEALPPISGKKYIITKWWRSWNIL